MGSDASVNGPVAECFADNVFVAVCSCFCVCGRCLRGSCPFYL